MIRASCKTPEVINLSSSEDEWPEPWLKSNTSNESSFDPSLVPLPKPSHPLVPCPQTPDVSEIICLSSSDEEWSGLKLESCASDASPSVPSPIPDPSHPHFPFLQTSVVPDAISLSFSDEECPGMCSEPDGSPSVPSPIPLPDPSHPHFPFLPTSVVPDAISLSSSDKECPGLRLDSSESDAFPSVPSPIPLPDPSHPHVPCLQTPEVPEVIYLSSSEEDLPPLQLESSDSDASSSPTRLVTREACEGAAHDPRNQPKQSDDEREKDEPALLSIVTGKDNAVEALRRPAKKMPLGVEIDALLDHFLANKEYFDVKDDPLAKILAALELSQVEEKPVECYTLDSDLEEIALEELLTFEGHGQDKDTSKKSSNPETVDSSEDQVFLEPRTSSEHAPARSRARKRPFGVTRKPDERVEAEDEDPDAQEVEAEPRRKRRVETSRAKSERVAAKRSKQRVVLRRNPRRKTATPTDYCENRNNKGSSRLLSAYTVDLSTTQYFQHRAHRRHSTIAWVRSEGRMMSGSYWPDDTLERPTLFDVVDQIPGPPTPPTWRLVAHHILQCVLAMLARYKSTETSGIDHVAGKLSYINDITDELKRRYAEREQIEKLKPKATMKIKLENENATSLESEFITGGVMLVDLTGDDSEVDVVPDVDVESWDKVDTCPEDKVVTTICELLRRVRSAEKRLRNLGVVRALEVFVANGDVKSPSRLKIRIGRPPSLDDLQELLERASYVYRLANQDVRRRDLDKYLSWVESREASRRKRRELMKAKKMRKENRFHTEFCSSSVESY